MSTAVANYFGIEEPDESQSKKLTAIQDYITGGKVAVPNETILSDLDNLKFKLGTEALGQSQLDTIYNYARIGSQISNY